MTKTQAGLSTETIGRGGLRLPEVAFEEDAVGVHPVRFIDFFRSTFRLNLKSGSGTRLPAENNPRAPASEQVVVPQGEGRPVVVLDYEFVPSNERYRGSDEHMKVLIPPTEVDEFHLYMKVDHHFRDPGTAGTRGYITLEHAGRVVEFPLFGLHDDEFYEYGPEQVSKFQLLGAAVSDFIKLVA